MSDESRARHLYDKKILKKHVRTGSTEGGACLNRHISSVTRSSCSHRWQGKMRAIEDSGWYNTYQHPDVRPGSWDVSDLPTSANFSKSYMVPYVHNAHHILPNSVLNECIAEATTRDQRLYDLVRVGLLEAQYNLNHKINMIILPKDRFPSQLLKLPRHLHMNAMEHTAYSLKVKKQVIDVIDQYQKQINVQNCKKSPDVAFSKAQLETISTTMRRAIRAWGIAEAPRTITSMSARFISFITGWR